MLNLTETVIFYIKNIVIIHEHPEFGYGSITDFIKDSIGEHFVFPLVANFY